MQTIQFYYSLFNGTTAYNSHQAGNSPRPGVHSSISSMADLFVQTSQYAAQLVSRPASTAAGRVGWGGVGGPACQSIFRACTNGVRRPPVPCCT